MNDEALSSARKDLFWALSEHSQADTGRLKQLINTVNHQTAIDLHESAMQALRSGRSGAFDGVVAELERVSATTLPRAESSSRVERTASTELKMASAPEDPKGVQEQDSVLKPPEQMHSLSMHQQQPPHSVNPHQDPVVSRAGPQLARIATRQHSRGRLEDAHYAAGTTSPSQTAAKFVDLSLQESDIQDPSASAHQSTVAARLLSKAGAVAQDPLSAASSAPVLPPQTQQQQHPARMHPHSAAASAASAAVLHHQFPVQQPQLPRPLQGPPVQVLQMPPGGLMPHSQAPKLNPLVPPEARQFLPAAEASMFPPHMHPSMQLPRLPGANTPQPLYSTTPLQPDLTMQGPAPRPYIMRHPAQRPNPQNHPLDAAAAPAAAVGTAPTVPRPQVPSIPNWCVVTGLPNATMPPSVPPDGVLNITHLLPWPLAVRSMLQRGVLGITLDPTVRETRGQIDQPSLMMMVTKTGELETVLTGITYRDMYLGRQNLSEPWRVPAHWEGDGSELRVQDLDCVRLVLSHEGLNLLSNSFEPFFLVVQISLEWLGVWQLDGEPVRYEQSARSNIHAQDNSSLMVLGNAPTDAYAGGGETEVGKLLWETIRTSMDSLQRVTDTSKQHTPAARPAESRAGSSSEALRGGWLQRLNHEKQKLALVIDWHDRQQPDLTWVSTLLINSKPVNSSEACVKKQDARDSAARMYLVSIGIHGHD